MPDGQRTDEQRMIASEFAANAMTNAVGTLLVYPGLARRIFTHDRYITSESTLPPGIARCLDCAPRGSHARTTSGRIAPPGPARPG